MDGGREKMPINPAASEGPKGRGLRLQLSFYPIIGQLRYRDSHFWYVRMPELPLAIDLAGCSGERNVTYRSPRWRSSAGVYVEVVALEVEFSSLTSNLVVRLISWRERNPDIRRLE